MLSGQIKSPSLVGIAFIFLVVTIILLFLVSLNKFLINLKISVICVKRSEDYRDMGFGEYLSTWCGCNCTKLNRDVEAHGQF